MPIGLIKLSLVCFAALLLVGCSGNVNHDAPPPGGQPKLHGPKARQQDHKDATP